MFLVGDSLVKFYPILEKLYSQSTLVGFALVNYLKIHKEIGFT